MARVSILVGTKKGAFLVESAGDRTGWKVKGPFCNSWPILHVNYDPASETILAAGGSNWYGPALWRSRDGGETWTHSSKGLTYGDGGPAIEKLWNVTPAHGSIYVGAEPAGLFRSDDGGESFVHVEGLRQHPTCPQWQPGNGGLCLHTIVPHPTDAKQMWVAASAVGTFYTADGGETWEMRNQGIRADYFPQEGEKPPFTCVHKVVMAPGNPNLLYQQSHQGVYRSVDGGQNWQWLSDELPSTFGFPIAVHPRDPQTLYVIPMRDEERRFMPEGIAAVWRSRNGGKSWEKLTNGLPQPGFVTVLREAMAVDRLDPAGVYFGTTTGQVFASRDEGDTWELAADFLPPISGIEVAVI